MKQVLVLLAVGIAAGAVVFGVWRSWVRWGQNTNLISGRTFPAPSTSTIDSNIVGLAIGDSLLIRLPSGRGAVRFDRMTSNQGADYTSWFVSAGDSQPARLFHGHVFERYWRTTDKTGTYVEDIGGSYQVQCGPLRIPWSASTWLYLPQGWEFAISTNLDVDFDEAGLEWHTSPETNSAHSEAR